MKFKEVGGNKEQKLTWFLRMLHRPVTCLKRHERQKILAYMHFDYQSGSKDSINTSILASQQALHLGDIMKRRRARGTRERQAHPNRRRFYMANQPLMLQHTVYALTKHVQRT